MAEGFGRGQRRELPGTQGNSSNYNGLWDAVVADDKDPLKIGRVRVRVLDLHDDSVPINELPWAYPCSPTAFINITDSTKSGGFFHVPPVDALVHVMFKRGDPDFPVWMGGWFPQAPAMVGRENYGSNTERDALYNASGQPTCPTWRSLRGHVIEMDDDSREIRITSITGHKITLSGPEGEHGECLKLEDKKGNYIWMQPAGNKLEIYFDGDIVEKCTKDRHLTVGGDYLVKVGGTHSVHVSGDSMIKTDGSHNIDGTILNLNSQLAIPVEPSPVTNGQASGGDKVGEILVALGNQIKKIVVGA